MRTMTLYNILSLCHIKYGKNVKEYLLCYLKLILHKARFKGLGKYTVNIKNNGKSCRICGWWRNTYDQRNMKNLDWSLSIAFTYHKACTESNLAFSHWCIENLKETVTYINGSSLNS